VTRLRSLIALLVLVVFCAAGNLLRGAGWTQASGFVWFPFSESRPVLVDANVHSYGRLDVSAPAWRPLRVTLRARATAAAAAATMMDVALDGEEQPPQALSTDWRELTLTASRPVRAADTLSLYVSAAGAALEIADVTLTPVPAVWPFVRYAATGGLFGLLLWAALVVNGLPGRLAEAGRAQDDTESHPAPIGEPARRDAEGEIGAKRSHARQGRQGSTTAAATASERGATADPRGATADRVVTRGSDWRAALLAGVAIFSLLGVWALIRPPIQTPDEPHHFVRTTSILLRPWVTGADHVAMDFRFINPISWEMYPLARIVFQPRERLSRADVEQVKAVGWHALDATGNRKPLFAAIASYPPLYYASLFAISQPIVSAAGLTPYQAFYFYRLASVFLTTLAWVAVYLLLRRTPDLSPWAGLIVATIVLIPTASFMSSGVNPDALSLPLITLAIVACWRTLSSGAQPSLTFAAALAAMWTKPSGTQVAGALIVGGVWCAVRGRVTRRHAWAAGRAVLLAALVAYATFYAWSPTYFYPVPGQEHTGLVEYVTHAIEEIPSVWVSFWGILGWLEYQLPDFWYDVLYLLVLLCAAWRWTEMRRGAERAAALTTFLAVYVAAFLASTLAGGFINLSVAGYMLQGRYFLPVAIGLAPLVMQETRWKRFALPAFVLLINLLLMRETVWRYYGGDWSLLWLSLPFV
jgi:hypothetical protein